jgi:aspartate carbamoyltransferase catalytic subunit
MLRLGGGVVGWADASVARFGDPTRGETFEDTIRRVEDYADVIVMRSPQTGLDYYPYVAAELASIPVIKAGFRVPPEDIEHPAQGLLDMYTVKKEKGKIDGRQNRTCSRISEAANGVTVRMSSYGYALGHWI